VDPDEDDMTIMPAITLRTPIDTAGKCIYSY